MTGLRLVTLGVMLFGASAFAEEERASSAPSSPKLELEVSAGATPRLELTPTVSGRVGVDLWNWFTPSVRVLSVAPWSGSSSAWAIQGELRAHTSGTLLQLTGGVGLGLATASIDRGSTELDATVQKAQPWLTGDVGARVLLGPFFLGASLGYAPVQGQWLGALSLGLIALGN